jgi:hypothetical protein
MREPRVPGAGARSARRGHQAGGLHGSGGQAGGKDRGLRRSPLPQGDCGGRSGGGPRLPRQGADRDGRGGRRHRGLRPGAPALRRFGRPRSGGRLRTGGRRRPRALRARSLQEPRIRDGRLRAGHRPRRLGTSSERRRRLPAPGRLRLRERLPRRRLGRHRRGDRDRAGRHGLARPARPHPLRGRTVPGRDRRPDARDRDGRWTPRASAG